jgi:hypothetical protein
MSRLFSSLLVFVFLLGQLALVTHAYEDHDSDTLCEICLTQSHQDHGLASSPPGWSLNSSYALVSETYQHDYSTPHIAHYAVRAPPAFL